MTRRGTHLDAMLRSVAARAWPMRLPLFHSPRPRMSGDRAERHRLKAVRPHDRPQRIGPTAGSVTREWNDRSALLLR